MADWAYGDTPRAGTAGVIYQTSRGTVLEGRANAKGSWGALNTALPFDADCALVFLGPHRSAFSGLIDIGSGRLGIDETVIVPNLSYRNRGPGQVAAYYLPVALGGNNSLVGRCQTDGGAADAGMDVSLAFMKGGFTHPSTMGRCTTYGVTEGASTGVLVDCGGTANVKGAWVQIASALSFDTFYLIFSLGHQSNFFSDPGLLDVGVGSAGNEVVLIPNIAITGSTDSFDITPNVIGPYAVTLRAGTRIAVRAQCSTAISNQRVFDVLLHTIG